jgi:hypothetical protein
MDRWFVIYGCILHLLFGLALGVALAVYVLPDVAVQNAVPLLDMRGE